MITANPIAHITVTGHGKETTTTTKYSYTTCPIETAEYAAKWQTPNVRVGTDSLERAISIAKRRGTTRIIINGIEC